jgi:hypothetical protein
MIDNIETKAAMTKAELARLLDLSRQRFDQLVKTGVFPMPIYNITTRRPYYSAELQQVCIDVRRRNFGVNGRPVLFYAKGRRVERPVKPTRPVKSSPKKIVKEEYPQILAAVHALGLAATSDQIASAVAGEFPAGVTNLDQGVVIRGVFLALKRKNHGDNVGR